VSRRFERPAHHHKLSLGHGVELRCAMDSLDDSVRVGVAWRGIGLGHQSFSRKRDHHPFRLVLPFLRVEVGVWADVFSGEVAGEGEIAVRPLVGRWRKLVDVERKALRFDPAVGEIGGKPDFAEPVVDHERYGRSQLCTPAILRLHVDEGERAISDAGRLVKNSLFARHAPFVFNTVACVGAADASGRGAYPNPNSVWFNVFFGCYQIDAPRSDWSRPFGYLSADGAASQIAFDDIARLGEADWNFFSNWMYGVPIEAIKPYNKVDPVKTVQEPAPELIGSTLWHRAAVEGVTCVSTYESGSRSAARLVTNSQIDHIWRRAFGLPNPQSDMPTSFMPTTLRAELHMAYFEDEGAYHTVICGGTATVPVDQEFLATQMTAIRAAIETSYPDCGFPRGSGPPDQPAAARASASDQQ
jgi:hypothetical protein